jgi:inner membrane protein
MDNLTHGLSGMLAGRLYSRKLPGGALPLKHRLWMGFVLANMPDLDIVLAPFSAQLYLQHHRGLSHSLLMLPLWALLLAGLLAIVIRPRGGLWSLFPFTALCLGLHIFGDWITGYGTQLFAPLSTTHYALGSTFILDPVLTGLLLLGVVASLTWRQRAWPAVFMVVLALGWIALEAHYQHKALEYGREYATRRGWVEARVTAEARPWAPFNWTVLVHHGEYYDTSDVHLGPGDPAPPRANQYWVLAAIAAFRPPAEAGWQTIPRFGKTLDEPLARWAWSAPQFAFFRRFAGAPALYRIDLDADKSCVWFQDLRFSSPQRPSPFRFGLCGPDWKTYRLNNNGQAERYQ